MISAAPAARFLGIDGLSAQQMSLLTRHQTSGPVPTASVAQGEVLRLSGEQFQEILDAVLSRGASVRFQARGFSMHPFIRDFDVVTVSPLPRRSLRAGDVIAFRQPCSGSLVLHRIQRVGPEGLLVRGDNLPASDGLVSVHDVIGLVTLAERDGAIAYQAADADASATARAVQRRRASLRP